MVSSDSLHNSSFLTSSSCLFWYYNRMSHVINGINHVAIDTSQTTFVFRLVSLWNYVSMTTVRFQKYTTILSSVILYPSSSGFVLPVGTCTAYIKCNVDWPIGWILSNANVLNILNVLFLYEHLLLSASTRIHRHTGVVFQDDISVLIEIKQGNGGHRFWYTTWRRNVCMNPNCMDHTLYRCVIAWPQFL